MAGTITHEWIGTTLVVTSDSGTSSCDLKGAQGDMGIRGAQGAPGECGTTSFEALTDEQKALLKGEKGDKGDKGEKGEPGEDGAAGVQGEPGYTPKKGIDYWTDEDKNEIKAYVDDAILNGEW